MEVKPVLSVLIASTKSREEMTWNLIKHINSQISANICSLVEVVVDWNENDNIGTKRNHLLYASSGDYIVFVDSDDNVRFDYISKILEACKSGSDCIGISGIITTNGKNQQNWHISKDFKRWFVRGNVYYRTPNHISPVKRELALQAGFPEISHGEDHEYSMRLLPLLKTETKIEGNLYHYQYRNDK